MPLYPGISYPVIDMLLSAHTYTIYRVSKFWSKVQYTDSAKHAPSVGKKVAGRDPRPSIILHLDQ